MRNEACAVNRPVWHPSALALGLLALAAGCRSIPVAPVEQPVTFERASYEAVWEATVAVLKEHFPIYTARKASGDVITQFEITYGNFEFWRDNAASARDRRENTVQTIRRRALVEVARAADGRTALTLTVEKERRDRAQEGARFSFAEAASIFQPETGALERTLRDPTSEDWMSLGRDRAFESYLLHKIMRRVGG